MVSGEHTQLEKMSSTTPMLEGGRLVGGKILIREDTLLGGLACARCGRARLRCDQAKLRARCWGDVSHNKNTCLSVTLVLTLFASVTGTLFFCFSNFLNDVIVSNMVLSNNSMAFEMWRKPTVEPLMKIHIFNYTNVAEVMEGREHKLRVRDLGPFVYAQSVERVNTEFHPDGTLSFQEKDGFTFLPELSEGLTQFDRVIVPNLPLLSTVHMSSVNTMMQYTLSLGTQFLHKHKDAFVDLPAHRFLWGYDDEIIDFARPILKLNGQMPFEKFGLLAVKNGTLPQQYTINTGEHDPNRLNFIESIDKKRSLGHWGTAFCNSIEATDGSLFPTSLLDRKRTLYVYKENLCRRIPFVYKENVKVLNGIGAYRYVIPDNVFDDPARNPENQCYCHMDSGVCPPRGLVNVSACAFETPMMASFPHFYLGDEKLIEAIDGLRPDAAVHSSYLDIHPTLGIPLNVRSGFQVNVQVPKTDITFQQLKFLKAGTVLPVAWIEATMGTIPESLQRLVYHGTYSTAAACLALRWGCGTLALLSAILLALVRRARPARPCLTLHVDSVKQELP